MINLIELLVFSTCHKPKKGRTMHRKIF